MVICRPVGNTATVSPLLRAMLPRLVIKSFAAFIKVHNYTIIFYLQRGRFDELVSTLIYIQILLVEISVCFRNSKFLYFTLSQFGVYINLL